MNSIERYRRYAADCLKMAQAATNDGDKARLLQMAELNLASPGVAEPMTHMGVIVRAFAIERGRRR
jgi:3-dehydroquinate dehydratase